MPVSQISFKNGLGVMRCMLRFSDEKPPVAESLLAEKPTKCFDRFFAAAVSGEHTDLCGGIRSVRRYSFIRKDRKRRRI